MKFKKSYILNRENREKIYEIGRFTIVLEYDFDLITIKENGFEIALISIEINIIKGDLELLEIINNFIYKYSEDKDYFAFQNTAYMDNLEKCYTQISKRFFLVDCDS